MTPQVTTQAENLLEGRALQLQYGTRTILQQVNVAVASGEVLGILGANGAGKTTLLRMLAGLLPPTQGSVWLQDHPLPQHPHPARQLAYLEQQSHSQWPMSVEIVVGLGRIPHLAFGQRMADDDQIAIEQAMRDADILHLRQRAVDTLSTGEQARVFLARALAVQPRVLLADEPVSGLDPAHQLTTMQMLHSKAREGLAVAVILHDLALAARFCDRLLLLHEGRLLAQGLPAQVLTPSHLRTALHIRALHGEYENTPYLLPWEPL